MITDNVISKISIFSKPRFLKLALIRCITQYGLRYNMLIKITLQTVQSDHIKQRLLYHRDLGLVNLITLTKYNIFSDHIKRLPLNQLFSNNDSFIFIF
jgi:hypothetical protein